MLLTPTLYITRNGLLEPLGQSQVMAYLRGLSQNYKITLITYEKSEDWANTDAMARARADCEAHGIRWLPQRFHPQPKIIAPAFSMIRMMWLMKREVHREGAQLIHARSYIPSAVALLVGRVTKIPFIFDMRALWPEELITAGRLRRGSFLHRAIVRAERTCLAKAAGVVSLTHAAVAHLKTVYPDELRKQRMVVIPTCADLNRFAPEEAESLGSPVYGCIGTVLSGWFRTDWLSNWIYVVAAHDPSTRFEIVTRDDKSRVRAALDPENKLKERLHIGQSSSEEMPDAVRRQDLSTMFFTSGLSKLGSAPTRLAEVLGCGVPVVVNEGVGDVAEIVRENNVGVIVDGGSVQDMETAFEALQTLMKDPDLPRRCRSTAEAIFSLEAGTKAYGEVYASILNTKDT
tara:strand:+ start:8419 stop:9627 length:1209 start_codon:yes stop_codon:yes gene_type:complete